MVICTKFTDLWDTKIEKTYVPKKKKIIAHKTVFTWFGNLPMFMKLQGFYYSQGKIHSAVVQFFSLKNIIKILIFKITVFISYTQDSQWTTKTGQNFFLGGIALGPPRRLVHKCYGLGLSTQASTLWTKFQKISH